MSPERLAKLQEYLSKDPNDSFSRYALAMEYAGQGDKPQAVLALEELIRRDPSYAGAYQHLAYLYRESGQTDRAVVVLKQGIDVARQQGDVHAAAEMQEALDEMTAP